MFRKSKDEVLDWGIIAECNGRIEVFQQSGGSNVLMFLFSVKRCSEGWEKSDEVERILQRFDHSNSGLSGRFCTERCQ